MELHGKNLIGGDVAGAQPSALQGVNPVTGDRLEPKFVEATQAEVEAAVAAAAEAAPFLARTTGEERAVLLEAVATSIEALGEGLIERADAETGLGAKRLTGERGRTVGQLRLFAEVVREGHWLGARIDRALPDRQPIPRPDLRRMLIPVGPVAVFGASNFPLAFSVAGGDTASALAAGCPVVVKAHPAHPGTSEWVGRAIQGAVAKVGLPVGTFSLLQGVSYDVGEALVDHPSIAAVAFTGSLGGGRALFDRAARRPTPVPVYAEMGSSNPVFILPGALAERGQEIAEGLAGSVTLGSGQFCTNPGLTVVEASGSSDAFLDLLGERLADSPAGIMVHDSIGSAYARELERVEAIEGVATLGKGDAGDGASATSAPAALLSVDGETYGNEPRLAHELYGPTTIAVRCADRNEMLGLARSLHGHLTATIHATQEDLESATELVETLRHRVGRVVFNGFPTGVEVSPAMHHGGPYPATTDPRSTSVGTAAIERFARPVCYQDCPPELLPGELRDENPLNLWRLVDGEWTRDPVP